MSQMGLKQDFGHPVLVELPRIALTKTVPPAVRKFAVQRPGLMRSLDHAAARRLIIFRAPAGYGKTTLAAEWCQRLRDGGALVAWLSLDIDDNEPGAFAYHLARAVDGAAPSLGRDAIALLHASSLIPPRNVISSLLNGVSEIDTETYLFLDDFHVVSDHRCHELMALLLRYAPSNLHLVLVSRAEPRLPLSRLRLDDQLAEIDAALLKFTLAETAELLGAELAQRLGNHGVAKLHRATEGWPAALQLARISLVNSANPLAHIGTISGDDAQHLRAVRGYPGDRAAGGRRLSPQDVDPRPDERCAVQHRRRHRRGIGHARRAGARPVHARAARRKRQLVPLPSLVARVPRRPAAHQTERPDPRPLP